MPNKDLKVAADVINKLFEEASRNYKKPNASAFPRTQAQTPWYSRFKN